MIYLRRVIGLVLVLSLPMAVVTGVVAQGSSDSEPVTAVLLDESGQICGLDLTTGTGSLGTWQRQGDGTYLNTSGGSTQEIILTVYSAAANGCDLTLDFQGLTGPQGGVIGPTFFTVTVANVSVPLEVALANAGSIASMLGTAEVGSDSVFLLLESVPSGLTPGLYTGNVNATIADAA